MNSAFSGGKTATTDFTLYTSPYLVAQSGGRYTKHIYVGSQRIVSKLGDFDSYGADPRRIEKAGDSFSGVKVDYASKYKSALNVVKANYESLKVPYYGLDNDDYVNGLGFCCNPATSSTPAAASGTSPTGKTAANKTDNAELQQYYYHPDHLGSSSYITNLDGEVVQHVEYVPFGEVFLEEKNAVWNTPFLFNGKELDKETGLNYFSARYQDPKTGIFISVDPLAEHSPNKTPYHYCSNNPINRTDPTGMCDDPNCTHGAIRRGWDAIGRFFGAWGHSESNHPTAKQSNVTAGPIEAGCPVLPFPPEAPMTVIEGGGAAEGAAAVTGISVGAVLVGVLGALSVSGDSRPKEDQPKYLYRNMESIGGVPKLGQNRFTLGIRPLDVAPLSFSDQISGTSQSGLSTTFSMGNVIPSNVPNATNSTSLFRINISSLPALGLKPTPISGNYWRITPLSNMSVETFNTRVQLTAPL